MSEQIPFIQPMTAEQTIQALKCCIDNNVNACDNCPIDKHIKDDCKCCQYLAENALNLINELKSDNEELKIKLDEEKENGKL